MANDNKQIWITTGYELFAKEGLKGLKIEVISKKIQKSKSSFYHYFADLEVFIEFLLRFHEQRSKVIAEKEKLCKNLEPDLINLLVEIKLDLLFNRQLRIHRHLPAFKACFEKSNREVENAFLSLWAKELGLSEKPHLAKNILDVYLENFYLQITEENLNYEWLSLYINNIQKFVGEFKRM
jgi:AcrR family transcriptional regulator